MRIGIPHIAVTALMAASLWVVPSFGTQGQGAQNNGARIDPMLHVDQHVFDTVGSNFDSVDSRMATMVAAL